MTNSDELYRHIAASERSPEQEEGEGTGVREEKSVVCGGLSWGHVECDCRRTEDSGSQLGLRPRQVVVQLWRCSLLHGAIQTNEKECGENDCEILQSSWYCFTRHNLV